MDHFKDFEKVDSMYRINLLFSSGVNSLKREDYKKACECFDKILDMDEGFKGVWLNRGVALGGLGDIKGEIFSYDMALEEDEKYDHARYNKEVTIKERIQRGDCR